MYEVYGLFFFFSAVKCFVYSVEQNYRLDSPEYYIVFLLSNISEYILHILILSEILTLITFHRAENCSMKHTEKFYTGEFLWTLDSRTI